MRYLLDTHVFLWMQGEEERIAPSLRERLADPTNDVLLSSVSSWEIAIKHGLGKLTLPEPPRSYVPDRMARSGLQGIFITHAHTLQVALLPRHHGDPFDRLLIAQAQVERVPIVTGDASFDDYDVEVIHV